MHAVRQIGVRVATVDDLDNVRAAYRAWDYRGSIGPNDKVFVAEGDGELLGIVRLAQEGETYVLRGMQVHAAFRRQGVGSRLLSACIPFLNAGRTFCLPYMHLVSFYGGAGFSIVEPSELPAFLAARLSSYLARGEQVLAMCRVTPNHTIERDGPQAARPSL